MTRHILLTTAALAAAALAPAAASANGVGGVPAASQSQDGAARRRRRAVPRARREGRAPSDDRRRVRHEGRRLARAPEARAAARAARGMVVTNAATGKLRAEIVDRPGETRIYDAEKHRVTISRTSSTTPAYTSSAFEAALHRAYVQQGIMRVTGEQIVAGRRALVLESVPGKWKKSDPGSRADGARRRADLPGAETASILDDGQFHQTVTTRSSRRATRRGGRGEARHAPPRRRKADRNGRWVPSPAIPAGRLRTLNRNRPTRRRFGRRWKTPRDPHHKDGRLHVRTIIRTAVAAAIVAALLATGAAIAQTSALPSAARPLAPATISRARAEPHRLPRCARRPPRAAASRAASPRSATPSHHPGHREGPPRFVVRCPVRKRLVTMAATAGIAPQIVGLHAVRPPPRLRVQQGSSSWGVVVDYNAGA